MNVAGHRHTACLPLKKDRQQRVSVFDTDEEIEPSS